jgi:hypothetical protein
MLFALQQRKSLYQYILIICYMQEPIIHATTIQSNWKQTQCVGTRLDYFAFACATNPPVEVRA